MPYQVEFLDIQKVEQYVDKLQALTRISSFIKPNQKQFKQFDESLFKAYIDKFSDEDKAKALEIIFKSLPNSLACNFILENS